MTLHTLPALSDNLVYLLEDNGTAAVVDPGEARPVEEALERLNASLETLLVTHTHPDHTAGCKQLQAATGCTIAGPRGTPALDRELTGGDTVNVVGEEMQVIAAPGHMANHLVYYAPAANLVFSGDTLIAGACGRILGATAADLWTSLLRIRGLPPDTRVCSGHDYMIENMTFAAELEPANEAVRDRLRAQRERVHAGKVLAPPTVAEEAATNPFLRCDDPALAEALGMTGAAPEEIFARIRKRKDRFAF